ncbi:MAG: YhbY family RNA-binding protein, partial [Gammaproteobacteria bacterium]
RRRYRCMPLDAETRKRLRGIGHRLHPVVTVAGKGLSDAVLAEADRALREHELVKVRFSIADRDERRRTVQAFCAQLGAESVQEIGKVLLAYRENPSAEPRLSNVRSAPES